jgi:putative hydrolase of the HAD superfamily
LKSVGIENIIFDLGNTLVYFDFCYFYDRIAHLEKKLNPSKFRKFINDKKLGIKLTKGTLDHKTFFRILKKKFDLKIGYDEFKYFYSDVFWINNQMKNFLDKISRIKKYKLFLLSNTDALHMNFIDKNFPFVGVLKNRVLSYKVGMIKPQKVIFRYTLKKYNLNPEKTLIIDDIKENILSASSLGIKTILYKNHRSFIKKFSALAKNAEANNK